MGKIAHVRVESRPLPSNAGYDQQDRNFKGMLAAFKKKVNEDGILTIYNLRSTYESKSQKKRRKLKESELRRRKELSLQSRLRDNFGQG
jgi:ribosomal protein S21